MTATHFSTYAGSWYPGQAAELRSLLHTIEERSQARTGPAILPHPLAFIVPHAGLTYSGTVATAAYHQLKAANPSRVVLLGFLHSGAASGVITPDLGAYATPLGRTPVDLTGFDFPRLPLAIATDHSAEIQLPLLQSAVPDVPVAPLYVGCLTAQQRSAAARAIAAALRPGDILLASTDLTHYGRSFHYEPFPLDYETPNNLHQLDHSVIDAAGSLDDSRFLDELRRSGSTTCGAAPVALLLRTLTELGGEEVFQELLDYQTSGDITGDYRTSVGYAALGYFRTSAFQLSLEDQRELLASAHDTLRLVREGGIERPLSRENPSPALQRKSSVFVSLHHHADLLGCIGRLAPVQPLAQSIPELTLDALHDPRFPTRRHAPPDVEVEISILTPMKPIADAAAFRIREHGALLECWGHRGLLLPQVARKPEHTSEWFLNALSLKAGLPPAAWRGREARLSVFRAQVFSA
ncbi:MAG: AmmeMemoRadiSam system protein B [Acidobacteria bacterium]|nr:AmmeMemoRadiSam system protein B [Acidobacteriota bacterium]